MPVEPTGSFNSDAEADLAILQQLLDLGADLRQAREVNHFLLFSREEIGRRVAKESGRDWRSSVAKEADGRWSVRLTHHAVVTSDDFAEIRASLKRVASALGGVYDGWEASAKP
jgi:hypothetical protein